MALLDTTPEGRLMERWFRELTDKAIRRGSFASVPDLVAAIEEYLAVHNENPKPFVWTATAASNLEKVRCGRAAFTQTISLRAALRWAVGLDEARL